MNYKPAPSPTNLGAVPRYVDQELRRISQEFDLIDERFAQVANKLAYPTTLVLYSYSEASQQPTGLGDAGKIQISFGPPQSGAGNAVNLSGAGLITFNQSGFYTMRLSLSMTQTSQSKDVRLVVRALKNDVQAGLPFAVGLADSSVFQQEMFTFDAALVAGDTVRFELMREIFNSGGLTEVVTGWGPTPSALIQVAKY